MWLGFSKSLGGGFRVGVGTRIFEGSRQRNNGPTQRDLARYEKTAFIEKIASESNELLSQLLVNNNIDPTSANRLGLDLDVLFGKTDQNNTYKEFVSRIKEVKETISKVQYGGNLTSQRKDRLVDLVFEMREAVATTGPGLNIISDEVSEKYGNIGVKYIGTIFTILFVLLMLNESSSFFSSLFTAAITTGILYIPAHFIIKFLAKKNYSARAESRMREVYGIGL